MEKQSSAARFIIIGPCGLESIEQVKPIVEVAQLNGVKYFRANIFKPRTNPYSFQGLGLKGMNIIEYLLGHGLKLVTEACSVEQLKIVNEFASVIQIGTRNMQNFELLKSIGKNVSFHEGKYVMLKRGFSNNMSEWLNSAEYLKQSGVPQDQIILCERGSRNFSAPSGVTLDLGLALKVKLETDYKVIIDPSHGSREAQLVLPLAKAAVSMNFDGVMVETHPRPLESKSDPQQAVRPDAVNRFLQDVLGTAQNRQQDSKVDRDNTSPYYS